MNDNCFRGVIAHGRGVGRTMGMPTANLLLPPGAALPAVGVYVSLLTLNGQTFHGVTNVGTRPTVDDEPDVTVETHVLDFDGDLYGEDAQLRLCKKLREPQKFESRQALIAQIAEDIRQAREFFS